jgi:hypothetical protein
MTAQPSYLSSINRFSRAGALLVTFVGAAVTIGWIRDFVVVKSVFPGLVNMKVNTALGFGAAGVALWSVQSSAPVRFPLARVLAVVVALLGGLTLAQYVFGIDLGIDQLIVRDVFQGPPDLHPGRMAATTALSFLCTGLALFVLKARRARFLPRSHWLVVPPLFIATVVLVGYAYDVRPIYKPGPHGFMPAHTALCFLVLSLSILAADPERGIARIFVSDTAGGVVARRLLPTLPFILFALGWAPLAAQEAGFYDAHFGFALTVVLSITVSVLAVASTAVSLHALDVKRKFAEAEIIALNAGLEQRVKDRTQELQNSLAQVTQLSGMLPICAWCKKIRDDQDYWHSVEQYVTARTDARFTHGICPDCHTRVTAQDTIPA